MSVAPQTPELNVTQVFTGKRLLFAGATGFVGKVTLSMLLTTTASGSRRST